MTPTRPLPDPRGFSLPLTVLFIFVLFVLVVTFMGSLTEHTGMREHLLESSKASAAAAAGVHVAIACLRQDSTFRTKDRGALRGKVSEARFEATIEGPKNLSEAESGALQADDPDTVWILENMYLKIRCTGTCGRASRTVEVLVSQRSPFTEFAVYSERSDLIPWTYPPWDRDGSKGWDPARIVAWLKPGASQNPDHTERANDWAGLGYTSAETQVWSPLWGGGKLSGGPLFSQYYFPCRDFVIPVGLQCADYILVQPGHEGKAGVDDAGDGVAHIPLYSSDEICDADPDDYQNKLSAHPSKRILDRSSGGALEAPVFDFDFYKAKAKQNGIYIDEKGKPHFNGFTPAAADSVKLYPTTTEVFYDNTSYASYLSPPRWSQSMVRGPWVNLGLTAAQQKKYTAKELVDRDPFHADNLPESGLMYSECNIQIQGPIGKALTIYCPPPANVMVCGDVNCDAEDKPTGIPFALCTGPNSKSGTVSGWSFDHYVSGLGAYEQTGGWLNFSVHKREGHYSTWRHRATTDPEAYLGANDHFDIGGVVIHAYGCFFDGFRPGDASNEKTRRIESGTDTDSSKTLYHNPVCGGYDPTKTDNDKGPDATDDHNYTRGYTITVHGALGAIPACYAEGSEFNIPRLDVVYDQNLLKKPPPWLPVTINIVRWRTVPQ